MARILDRVLGERNVGEGTGMVYGRPGRSPKRPLQLQNRNLQLHELDPFAGKGNRNGNRGAQFGRVARNSGKAFDMVEQSRNNPIFGGSNRKGGSTIQHGKP